MVRQSRLLSGAEPARVDLVVAADEVRRRRDEGDRAAVGRDRAGVALGEAETQFYRLTLAVDAREGELPGLGVVEVELDRILVGAGDVPRVRADDHEPPVARDPLHLGLAARQ